jgi:hypothetical protein
LIQKLRNKQAAKAKLGGLIFGNIGNSGTAKLGKYPVNIQITTVRIKWA